MEPGSNDEQKTTNQPWEPMHRENIKPEIMDVIKIIVDELPQLPVHVNKLLKIMSNTDIDSREVARIASSDPGMVSKILKAVNSSYYGLSKKTENLHLAITILGLNEIKRIALQSGFSKIFGDGWIYKGYDTRDLWEHSYLVSVCTETLTKARSPHEIGKLITYGILHDIGKYVLYKLVVLMKKKRIRPFKSKTFSSLSLLLEKEETLFGANHTVIGSMLAEKWDLSEKICAVLEYHHYPSFWSPDSIPTEYREAVTIICISDFIVNQVCGKIIRQPEPASEYFDILELTSPTDTIVSMKLEKKIEEAKQFVNLLK
jgi:HD-like signal output (HDOD) protein